MHNESGGYETVTEYIPIAQPNASTLAKINALEPSTVTGDRTHNILLFSVCRPIVIVAIDALIVGIETQAKYLSSKKTWTRKIILVTDGENPIEVEDWEATVEKMNSLNIALTVVYVRAMLKPYTVLNPCSL